MFILYDWRTNTILTAPIKDAKDKTMINAFKENIKYLSKWEFKPTLSIIYNIASKAIREYVQFEVI